MRIGQIVRIMSVEGDVEGLGQVESFCSDPTYAVGMANGQTLYKPQSRCEAADVVDEINFWKERSKFLAMQIMRLREGLEGQKEG